MVSSETFEMWRNRLDSFTQSKLKPREWCEQHEITLHHFYYWRQRIPKVASANSLVTHAKTSGPEWLAVDLLEPASAASASAISASARYTPSRNISAFTNPSRNISAFTTPTTATQVRNTTSASAPAGLNIHIAGAVIELQHGFDPALLQQAVQALRTLTC